MSVLALFHMFFHVVNVHKNSVMLNFQIVWAGDAQVTAKTLFIDVVYECVWGRDWYLMVGSLKKINLTKMSWYYTISLWV